MNFRITFLKTNPSRQGRLEDDNLVVWKEYPATMWEIFSKIFVEVPLEAGRIYQMTKEWFNALVEQFSWLNGDNYDWFIGVDL